MSDDRGADFGILSGIGVAIAAAVVLLFVLAMLRSSAPADRTIALHTAAAEVCGDIETVGAMALPYAAERHYEFDGMRVNVSNGYVSADYGSDAFIRPFAGGIVPGRYVKNGTTVWDGPAGMREYLNGSFGASGTPENPIDSNNTTSLKELLGKAGRETLDHPVEVPQGHPLVIQKIFIYAMDGEEAEPCVLVYAG